MNQDYRSTRTTPFLLTRSTELIERRMRFGEPRLRLPLVIERASGSSVWDLDGNRYIDMTASHGAVLLGHADPDVDAAVERAVRGRGNIFVSNYSPEEDQLRERLVAQFPCAESALFYRTGSCANTAAVRLAQYATGKRVVLTAGYHGWHDWQVTMFPPLRSADSFAVDFAYNLNLLEHLFELHSGNVAAVDVAPEPNFFDAAYHAELRRICDREGALLIFDEVFTGIRHGYGGYQRACGVTPNLAAIGKGLANGFGISAVLGPREVLALAKDAHVTGTFNRERTPIVAALETVRITEERSVRERLIDLGTRVMDGLNAVFAATGIRALAWRCPQYFYVVFEREDVADAFNARLLNHGVLMHPQDAAPRVTYAHTEEEIDYVLAAATEVLAELVREDASIADAQEGGGISDAAIARVTLNEFGGLRDYRAPIESLPRYWEPHFDSWE